MKKDEIRALPELVQDYLRYQGTIRNKSKTTIDEYSLDLRTFLRFLCREKNHADGTELADVDIRSLDLNFFKELTLEDAYSFIAFCKDERGNSSRTLNRKISAIRGFYKYLTINRRLLEENPMLGLETPKISKNLPKYLTFEQSVGLLSCIDGKNRERDYCIITFFLNCGLRLSELVSLDYTDIMPDGTAKIMGKGAKERTVYLNEACMRAFRAYMEVRPKNAVKDKSALFLSGRLQRISNKTVQHLVYTFLEKSGLGEQGFSVHKLRHTAATLMYREGADVLVLKELLGHESLNTTQIYTHVYNEEIKKAVASNPLAKIDGANGYKSGENNK